MIKNKSKKKKIKKEVTVSRTANNEFDASNFNPTKGIKGKIVVIIMAILMVAGVIASVVALIYAFLTRV